MGIDDIVNKAKRLHAENKDRIDEALRSEQAEKISDGALDAGSKFAKGIAPDHVDDKIDEFRNRADRSIGNE